MALRKKQKVVLRQKVKVARWREFKDSCIRGMKFLFFAALLVSSLNLLYRFLFISDFFLIKWIEVNQDHEKIVKKIRKEVEPLKGQSTFKLKLTKMEEQILRKFPELKTCELNRSLPDKIKIQFTLRTPLAWIAQYNHNDAELIDEEGIRFVADSEFKNKLSELALSSSIAPADALSFLKMWSLSSQEATRQGTATPFLGKLAVNDTGEMTLLLVHSLRMARNNEIFWGSFDSKTFAEKFQRLQDVWRDLEEKGLSASEINLQGVPERKVSVLGDTEIVGRVFVKLR